MRKAPPQLAERFEQQVEPVPMIEPAGKPDDDRISGKPELAPHRVTVLVQLQSSDVEAVRYYREARAIEACVNEPIAQV